MDYPSGNWKYCSRCGDSYFRYDDGVGGCGNRKCPTKVAELKEYKRQEKRDAELLRLRKEKKKLKNIKTINK
jgi:hypothetical protein